ncbi:MAG: hypothetical protein BRC26_03215, partial [Nanohaloarchaea archaeon QH_8_44_6]
MASVNDIIAEQMMETDPSVALTSNSIAQIKRKMEDNNLRAIPVVDEKDKLHGAIGYRDIIRFIQFNPDRTKLDKVMHQPPEFDTDDTLVELAELRINSGRKMLVNTSNGGKLKGIIGDRQFAEAMKNAEELTDVTTRELS